MSEPSLDVTELTEVSKRLLMMARIQFPRESKKFLQKEGTKLKNATKKKARQKKIKKTGNYLKSIKRGRMYKHHGDPSIRVYSSARNAHWVEKGHRIVTKSGREVGFARGQKVFEKAGEEFTNQFVKDCEDFIDELLEKGLG